MFEGQFTKDQFGNPIYDVAPDGQRFVVLRQTEASSPRINVIMNWFDELRRLAPRD